MGSHEAIRSGVKVCMFDQYGTVVDMQGGLTAVAAGHSASRRTNRTSWCAA